MSKITLDNVASGFNLSLINGNFQKLEDELNTKVFYRDSPVGEPNQLESQLDANSNRIINLPTPISDSEPATKKYVTDFIQADTNPIVQACIAAKDQAEYASNVAVASQDAAVISETNAAASAADAHTDALAAAAAIASLSIPPGESVVIKNSDTGAAKLPAGTTANRPTGITGMFRFNSTLGRFEGYGASSWGSVGGATGGGSDDAFYENTQTITTDYTISSGKNAMSAGPITVNGGITVTVPSGSTWTVVGG